MSKNDVEMYVAGLVLDPGSNAPIVILKDSTGNICLPIWIGLSEATAIASALKKVEIVRPMTHDLLKNLIDELGGRVMKIHIRSIENNTFFADIELVIGETIKIIDARPSDAIALAVRVGCSITVAREVLDQAQVTLVTINPETLEEVELEPQPEDSENQNFANIEKDKWEEILAEMDPEDFKYKM